MRFPPGKPILLLIVVAIFSGAGLLLFPPAVRGPGDLVLWTFDDARWRADQQPAAELGRLTDQHVSIELISAKGLNALLSSMFLSGHAAQVVPDAAEIEIGSIGQYFRPPTRDVGFLPLNDFLRHGGYRRIRSLNDPGQTGWNAVLVADPTIYLRANGRWIASPAPWPDWVPGTGDRTVHSPAEPGREGWHARLEPDSRVYHFDGKAWRPDPSRTAPDAWIDRLLSSRLAPWTKSGEIFGVPEDVHPVTITYRADLFAEAGVDLAAAATWPEFQNACLRFQAYWAGHGFPHRHAIELSHGSSDDLEILLLQRHINLIDANQHPHLTDPIVLRTLVFYAQLVAGPGQIGANPAGGAGLWSADLSQGNVCAMITPDWRAQELRVFTPGLAGKLRMMPLPRFDPADAPTSTWGGTMIGIPRDSRRAEQAWRLIEYLYLDPPDTRAGAGVAAIDATPIADAGNIPPMPERWTDPRWHQPDPYFGGQSVGGLYVQLAGQIPPRCVTPSTAIAEFELAFVLGQAVRHVEKHGPGGLTNYCQPLLQYAEGDLQRRIAQGRFE